MDNVASKHSPIHPIQQISHKSKSKTITRMKINFQQKDRQSLMSKCLLKHSCFFSQIPKTVITRLKIQTEWFQVMLFFCLHLTRSQWFIPNLSILPSLEYKHPYCRWIWCFSGAARHQGSQQFNHLGLQKVKLASDIIEKGSHFRTYKHPQRTAVFHYRTVVCGKIFL